MMRIILALALMISPALAQNSFVTAGGATVPGVVLMCIVGNVAVPCSGTSNGTNTYPTAGGATVGGVVRMCIVANVAVTC